MRTAIFSIALAALAQLSAALPAPDVSAVASSYVAGIATSRTWPLTKVFQRREAGHHASVHLRQLQLPRPVPKP